MPHSEHHLDLGMFVVTISLAPSLSVFVNTYTQNHYSLSSLYPCLLTTHQGIIFAALNTYLHEVTTGVVSSPDSPSTLGMRLPLAMQVAWTPINLVLTRAPLISHSTCSAKLHSSSIHLATAVIVIVNLVCNITRNQMRHTQ